MAASTGPTPPGEVVYERAFDEIAALADTLKNQREADYAVMQSSHPICLR
jgi:hypothetical protein